MMMLIVDDIISHGLYSVGQAHIFLSCKLSMQDECVYVAVDRDR